MKPPTKHPDGFNFKALIMLTTEATRPAKGDYVPSNHGKRLAASRLRVLAEWLDGHEVYDHEIASVSTDGWSELRVQVTAETFARLMDGKPFNVNGRGHADAVLDGVCLMAVFH